LLADVLLADGSPAAQAAARVGDAAQSFPVAELSEAATLVTISTRGPSIEP
jgi:hypothetical protein